MKKLAVITTHPIQYYAPVFKLLQQRQQIEVMVFYTWGEGAMTKYDPGFKRTVAWDIPLLDGYNYQWAVNVAEDPGSHNFKGIETPGLIAQVTAWNPDALLVYGWGYKSHLKILRHFKNKVPVFFRGDSTLLDENKGVKNVLKTLFLKWVYRHVDYAFYVGSNNKLYFKKYGLKDSQLVFAPHAIDNSRFEHGDPEKSASLRDDFGIRDAELLIIFAGKLETKKSPGLLLSCFIKLNATGVHLLFAGNGPLKDELKEEAKKNPYVHFIDFQNQSVMPSVYTAGDIFCLPSGGPGETWGLAVNEAMACSKPVLISDKVGCAADLVNPGVNGEIFKSGSEQELSLKLKKLIDEGKSGLAAMGKNSKKIIDRWSFETQAQIIEETIKNISRDKK